jgi:hypothetical protein
MDEHQVFIELLRAHVMPATLETYTERWAFNDFETLFEHLPHVLPWQIELAMIDAGFKHPESRIGLDFLVTRITPPEAEPQPEA